MLYAIDAKEQIYGGMHGIRTLIVDNFEDVQEADECGIEASRDLIESHCLNYLKEEVESQIEEEDDFDYFIEEAINDDIDFTVYKIKDEYQKQLPEDLEGLFYEDSDEFIEKYCEDKNSVAAQRIIDKFFA